MASCGCFSWCSSTRSKGSTSLAQGAPLKAVTSKGIPIWRHPHVSWKDKLCNYIARTPLPRLSELRYPEDGDEIKRLRDEFGGSLGQMYRFMGQLARWSVRTEYYKRADGTQGEILLHEPIGSANPPVLLWLHGGGFTVGTVKDPNGIRLANLMLDRGLPVVLACVEYRLAPEDPFPAAVDDCVAGLLRLVDLGLSPSVHVAGVSAGATLAAALLVEFAQRGQQLFKSVLLDCPFVDPECSNPSYELNARLIPPGNWLRWCWDVYLGRSAAEKKKAVQGLEQLRQLIEQSSGEGSALPLAPPCAPPVLVVTALADPLYDEGTEYVQMLKRCGAAVDHFEAKTAHGTWVFNDAAFVARVLDCWAPLLSSGGAGGAAPNNRL